MFQGYVFIEYLILQRQKGKKGRKCIVLCSKDNAHKMQNKIQKAVEKQGISDFLGYCICVCIFCLIFLSLALSLPLSLSFTLSLFQFIPWSGPT